MRTGQVGTDGVFRYRVQSVDVESLFVLSPWEGARVVLGRHRLGAGEVKDLGEVRLERGREIRGRVVNRAGGPAPGVTVRAALVGLSDEGDGMRRGAPESQADAEGRFVIRGVHRGPAVLKTKHPTWAPAAMPEDRGGAEAVIVVVPGAFLEGVLRVEEGAESGPVWLELDGPDGLRRIVIPGAGGQLQAGPLPPGVHRAGLAGLPRARRDLGPLDLAAGETRRVTWSR